MTAPYRTGAHLHKDRPVASAAYGYVPGMGGTYTQSSSKSTAITATATGHPNPLSGTITMNNASLAAGTTGTTGVVAFTVTNANVAANDYINIQHDSGGASGSIGSYTVTATPAAGTFVVNVRNNTAGALTDALVLRFFILKGQVA